MENLSNIELFFSEEIKADEVILKDDEFHHCVKVFRRRLNDIIYVTDGLGNLYKAVINKVDKNFLIGKIQEKTSCPNTTSNFIVCIPLLKNKDRFRFAIEKSVELGITKFYFFVSERSVVKKFDNKKIRKIMIESIKQSLRTHLPEHKFFYSFDSLIKNIKDESQIFVFDLEADNEFNKNLIKTNKDYFFIFGPEGGLSSKELQALNNERIYNLSRSRLRTETAVIKLVSTIT